MSIRWMNLVWESEVTRKLTPSTKNVLAMIANNASDDGIAISIKVDKICRQTNLDERTVQKAFRALETEGFVMIKQRPGRVSIYTLQGPRFDDTPGITPGVGAAPSQDRGTHQKTPTDSASQGASPRSTSAQAHDQPAGTQQEHAGNSQPQTPGITPGVSCGEACGSNIHSPGVRPPAPGVMPGLPPASGHPPPASGHPSPLLLHKERLLSSEAPDDLKKSPNRKSESGRRRIQTEPSAADRERNRAEAMRKIDEALQAKGMPA
jgi:hypothetical protein